MNGAREIWLQTLEALYEETGHPRGELKICTNCAEAPCEVGPEQVTLLPFEAEYIQTRLAREGRHQSLETINSIAGCDRCPFFEDKRCAIHPHRPIDCRTYPLVPVFQGDDLTFQVSGVCPLRAGMDQPFIELMEAVWQRLLHLLPQDWRREYNDRQPAEHLLHLAKIRKT
jgi:Fe-S-cluster containining protein